jgi:hypothetical protein
MKITMTGTLEVDHTFGLKLTPLKSIPPGLCVPDLATRRLFVHPDTLNKLLMLVDDQDGERSFPA